MTSLERMDDSVLDELIEFLHASDELTLPTAFALNDLDQDLLLPDTKSLLALPLLSAPVIDTPQAPVVATEQSRRRSKDAERRSVYRQRQRDEKEALRCEIDKLSAKLDKLQDPPSDGSVSPSTDLALSSCLWKAIASRQKEHREAAEKEQLHLRAAISSRATLIDDLCGFLNKRVQDGAVVNGDVVDAARHKRMRLEPTDSVLFETFIQELHTVYLQADEVVGACGLETSAAPSVTKHRDGRTEYYQHADRQSLPFKLKHVGHSLWHLAQLKHRQEGREIYEGVEDPENTIALKFRVTRRRMGEKVSLLQRVVARRFQETNRVVVVWKLFTEGEGMFRWMHADETGWSIARPSTSSDATGTILDTCFRHVPMHFSNSASCTPVVDEFTNMVVSRGEEENQTVLKALEKMLLDDTVASVMN